MTPLETADRDVTHCEAALAEAQTALDDAAFEGDAAAVASRAAEVTIAQAKLASAHRRREAAAAQMTAEGIAARKAALADSLGKARTSISRMPAVMDTLQRKLEAFLAAAAAVQTLGDEVAGHMREPLRELPARDREAWFNVLHAAGFRATWAAAGAIETEMALSGLFSKVLGHPVHTMMNRRGSTLTECAEDYTARLAAAADRLETAAVAAIDKGAAS